MRRLAQFLVGGWMVSIIGWGGGGGYAAVWEVCPSCPVRSIKAAVEQSTPYDTIRVWNGVYRESRIVIRHPLVLEGIDSPVVDGSDGGGIFWVGADSSVIRGFVLRHVPTSHIEDWAGIRVIEADHCLVEGNYLEGMFFGIYLQKAHHCTVRGNRIVGHAKDEFTGGNGIHLWYSDHILVENNFVRGHRDGIYIEYANYSRFERNHSEYNIRYGMHFMFSDDDEYHHNTFRRNGAGVAVMFSRRISMTHNTFEDNWGPGAYGLLLKEIYDAAIENNLFRRNTIGIYGESAVRIVFRRNHLEHNGKAILFLGSCYDDLFTENNFLYNTFDLFANAELRSNRFERNYWSGYTGYDLDRDGIGDVPYRPMSLFAYIVSRNPTAIILLRSIFVDLLNFSEKVMPIFLPQHLEDPQPLMQPIS